MQARTELSLVLALIGLSAGCEAWPFISPEQKAEHEASLADDADDSEYAEDTEAPVDTEEPVDTEDPVDTDEPLDTGEEPEDTGCVPAGPEVAGNATDEDCDLVIACYADVDGDGFPHPTNLAAANNDADCDDEGEGTDTDVDDCDDTNSSIKPGATDFPNGINDDCGSGTVPRTTADLNTAYGENWYTVVGEDYGAAVAGGYYDADVVGDVLVGTIAVADVPFDNSSADRPTAAQRCSHGSDGTHHWWTCNTLGETASGTEDIPDLTDTIEWFALSPDRTMYGYAIGNRDDLIVRRSSDLYYRDSSQNYYGYPFRGPVVMRPEGYTTANKNEPFVVHRIALKPGDPALPGASATNGLQLVVADASVGHATLFESFDGCTQAFGSSLAFVGPMNLFAGCPGASSGAVFRADVAAVTTSASITTLASMTDPAHASLGAAIVGCDLDGRAASGDAREFTFVAVSAPGKTSGTAATSSARFGYVFVYRVDATAITSATLPTAPSAIVTGTYSEEHFGQTLVCADFDDDGIDDLIVGAPSGNPTGDAKGSVYIFRGSSVGWGSTTINLDTDDAAYALHATAKEFAMGEALARVPNARADGRDGVVIGLANNGMSSGFAVIDSRTLE